MGEDVADPRETMRRRTLVTGAAWAAPVVTLGAAAPAEAASPSPISASVSWTCTPGRKDQWTYTVSLTLTNGLGCGTSVRVSSLKVSVGGSLVVSGSRVVQVPPGQSRTVSFGSQPTRRSGVGTGSLTYSYRDCGGTTRQESRAVRLTALSSCGGKDRDEGHDNTDDTAATTDSTPDGTPTPNTPMVDPAPTPAAPVTPSPATPSPAAATPAVPATD